MVPTLLVAHAKPLLHLQRLPRRPDLLLSLGNLATLPRSNQEVTALLGRLPDSALRLSNADLTELETVTLKKIHKSDEISNVSTSSPHGRSGRSSWQACRGRIWQSAAAKSRARVREASCIQARCSFEVGVTRLTGPTRLGTDRLPALSGRYVVTAAERGSNRDILNRGECRVLHLTIFSLFACSRGQLVETQKPFEDSAQASGLDELPMSFHFLPSKN